MGIARMIQELEPKPREPGMTGEVSRSEWSLTPPLGRTVVEPGISGKDTARKVKDSSVYVVKYDFRTGPAWVIILKSTGDVIAESRKSQEVAFALIGYKVEDSVKKNPEGSGMDIDKDKVDAELWERASTQQSQHTRTMIKYFDVVARRDIVSPISGRVIARAGEQLNGQQLQNTKDLGMQVETYVKRTLKAGHSRPPAGSYDDSINRVIRNPSELPSDARRMLEVVREQVLQTDNRVYVTLSIDYTKIFNLKASAAKQILMLIAQINLTLMQNGEMNKEIFDQRNEALFVVKGYIPVSGKRQRNSLERYLSRLANAINQTGQTLSFH